MTTRRTSTRRTSTRRTSTVAAAVLSGLLVLSACGGGDDPTVASGDTPAASSSEVPDSAPYNAQDVSFVQGMTPHHEQAVEMADTILDEDPSPEVRALATKIKAAQGPEIDQLERLLETFGVEDTAGGGHGGHGGADSADGAVMHEGMMSEAEMAAFMDATGAEAERMFLEMMIEHHRGAVSASEQEIAGGEHPEAVALAREIKTAQEREIGEMEQLLARA